MMYKKLLVLALMCVFVGTVFALNPQKRIPMPNPWPPFGLPKNATEIIRGYGYPCEDHNTTTPDGFVLSIQHIPHGVNQTSSTKHKPVVFLQHGLQDCSVGWTLNLPNESLSYILADAGYDVWLGNNRATLYSMENLYYNISQPEYWAWSFDEMAKYDLPSQIDYVLNVTGAKTLTYIGHSQGTIQAFAGFLNPEVAAKVNLYVALAPIAYLGNIKSVMLKDLADIDADKLLELLGMHEFWLGPFPNITEVFLPAFCYEEPDFCMNIVSLWCGKSDNLNDTRTAYYLMYEPSPTSVQNIAHLAQEVRSGKFEMYNYGIDNMKYYGQKDPPIYDMTKFPPNLPTALFYGGQDDLADTTDVEALMNQLPTPPYAHYEPTYAHLDPLLGMDAAIKIYPRVLELMGMYSKYP